MIDLKEEANKWVKGFIFNYTKKLKFRNRKEMFETISPFILDIVSKHNPINIDNIFSKIYNQNFKEEDVRWCITFLLQNHQIKLNNYMLLEIEKK